MDGGDGDVVVLDRPGGEVAHGPVEHVDGLARAPAGAARETGENALVTELLVQGATSIPLQPFCYRPR